jgi:hypothetical protein
MTTLKPIEKDKQRLARQSLASAKLNRRRADTRRKIELGGLVIKSGMDGFSKAVILGALDYSLSLIRQDATYGEWFETKGNRLFLSK